MVVEAYAAGLTLSEVAVVVGASRSTVWRRLRQLGIDLRPRGALGGRKLCRWDVIEIRAALAAGAIRAHLSREYGVSWQAIAGIAAGQTWRLLRGAA